MKQSILIYGNCQAGAVSVILGADATIAGTYDVIYMPSFDDRNPGQIQVQAADIGRAAVLLEQHDPNEFPQRNFLPQDCLTVTFPSIDFNLLWPLNSANPYNEPPSPDFPWGRFPYGDRVIIDCVRRGLSTVDTLAYYDASAVTHLPDLDRFALLERTRLAARDAKCDVTMRDFIIENFAGRNLFWAVNHPTMSPLRELCARLIEQVARRSKLFECVDIDATIAKLPPQGPLGDFRIPIHPRIVDHFELLWYPSDGGRHFGPATSPLTYAEYLAHLTESSVRVRDQHAVVG